MRGELALNTSTLFGFLLVLTRMAGAMIFVPLPGVRNTPEPVRLVLAVGLTFALFPFWPSPASTTSGSIGWLLVAVAGEAALGLVIGVAVSLMTEGFLLAAQTLGLQAGYAYASAVDPTSQADSTVLQLIAQLSASLLFLAAGLDRQVIRILASSFETHPAGTFSYSPSSVEAILALGAKMFVVGLRLALPVLALLLLLDLALALLERVHSQLHLLTLAFPLKMAAALVIVAATTALMPSFVASSAEFTFGTIRKLLTLE
jgi:flagellar biosynthetic protein FliR